MRSDYLSRHVDNDDLRHFTFARTSGLPIGYFDKPVGEFLRWLAVWAAAISAWIAFVAYWS